MKYIKTKITSLLLITAVLFNCFSVMAIGETKEESKASMALEAKSVILMEPSTGKILFEQNPDEKLPIASVTKVMTMLLIYEALEEGKISMTDTVTVSEYAAGMGGSQIFLEPMEQQSVEDLVKSIVIASANDAAVAMGEFIGGSVESFVNDMNEKAKELGMENTVFKNPCGLDVEGQYSSARDVALMTRELITNYPDVFKYSTVWQDSIVHKTRRGEEEFGLTNTNKLIKWYDGATGLKTGSTSKALYCLSGTAEKNGLQLISVILAAPTPKDRFQETMKMFDYGFANYAVVESDAAGTIVGEAEVEKGKAETVEGEIKDVVTTVIKKGASQELAKEVMMKESVHAPIVKGEVIGEVIYSYENKEIGRSDILATEDVEEASLVDTLESLKDIWFK